MGDCKVMRAMIGYTVRYSYQLIATAAPSGGKFCQFDPLPVLAVSICGIRVTCSYREISLLNDLSMFEDSDYYNKHP